MCRTVYIHLLSLQGGSVYGAHPSGKIAYEFPTGIPTADFRLPVTRSRVMAHLSTLESGARLQLARVVVVWDVKTGDPVSLL